jgi:hypothetical protein
MRRLRKPDDTRMVLPRLKSNTKSEQTRQREEDTRCFYSNNHDYGLPLPQVRSKDRASVAASSAAAIEENEEHDDVHSGNQAVQEGTRGEGPEDSECKQQAEAKGSKRRPASNAGEEQVADHEQRIRSDGFRDVRAHRAEE